jgi:hypothetical protein
MKKTLVLTVCVLLLSGTALADWKVGDPCIWSQLPDTSANAMDTKAGRSMPFSMPQVTKVLADDFISTSPGKITGINIWGGWEGGDAPVDQWGGLNEGLVTFNMKIWSDVPASPTSGPGDSMPGNILWERSFSPVSLFRLTPTPSARGDWFNPNTQAWRDDMNAVLYQWSFDIDPADAFQPAGTPANPVVYWLSLEANPNGDLILDPEFGWRNTDPGNHWNDDAAFADWTYDSAQQQWFAAPWRDMEYPTGHQFAGQGIDLAFVLTPEPTTMALLVIGSAALIRRRRR